VTELKKTTPAPTGADAQTPYGGSRWIRRLTIINLGLVALQPFSAGFLMSGFNYAATAHAVVANALQLGAIIQAVTAIVLWRRRCVPGWVAASGVALFGMVFLQVGLGYNREYWLHVPIGVGLLGGLTRQVSKLDALASLTSDGVGHVGPDKLQTDSPGQVVRS
jgi:hypothetical protein